MPTNNIYDKIKRMFKFIKAKSCLIIFASSVFMALGIYNVHSLSKVTEGGILGTTLLLYNWFNISPAITTIILNAICYFIGFKILGKKFLFYSIFGTICYSLSYSIFEAIGPLFPEIANHQLLAAIVGAIFVGIGTGFCINECCALCGDDSLAMSLSKITHIKIQWIYLISDLTILLLSLTYIPFTKIIYSILSVVLSGQIIGFIEHFKKENKINQSNEQTETNKNKIQP